MRLYPQLVLWTYVLLPAICLLLSPTFIIALARAQQQKAKVVANALTARGRAAAALAKNHHRRYIPTIRYSNSFGLNRPYKYRTKRESDMDVPGITPPINLNQNKMDISGRASHGDQQEEALSQLANMWNMNDFSTNQNDGVIRSMHNENNEEEKSRVERVGDPYLHNNKDHKNEANADYYSGAFSGRNVFDDVLEASEPVSLMQNNGAQFSEGTRAANPEPTLSKLKKKLGKKQEPYSYPQNYISYYPQNSYAGAYYRSVDIEDLPQNEGIDANNLAEVNNGGAQFIEGTRAANPEPTLSKLKKKLGKKQEPYSYPQNYISYYPQNSYAGPYYRSVDIEDLPQNEGIDADNLAGVNNGDAQFIEGTRAANPEPTLSKLKKKLGKKQEPYSYPQNYISYYPQNSYAGPYYRSVDIEDLPQNEGIDADNLAGVNNGDAQFIEGTRAANPEPTLSKLKKKLGKKQEPYSYPQNYISYYPQNSYAGPYYRSVDIEDLPQNEGIDADNLAGVNNGGAQFIEGTRAANPEPTLSKLKKKLGKKQEPYYYPQNYISYYPQNSYAGPYYRSVDIEDLPQDEGIEADNLAGVNNGDAPLIKAANPEPTFNKKKKKFGQEHQPYPYPQTYQNSYHPQYSQAGSYGYPYYRDAEFEEIPEFEEEPMELGDMGKEVTGNQFLPDMEPKLGDPEPTFQNQKNKFAQKTQMDHGYSYPQNYYTPSYYPHGRNAEARNVLFNMQEQQMDNFMLGEMVLPRYATPEPTFSKKKDKKIEHMPVSFYYPQYQYNSYYSPNTYPSYNYNPYARNAGIGEQDQTEESMKQSQHKEVMTTEKKDQRVGEDSQSEMEQKLSHLESHHNHKKIEKKMGDGENFFYSSNFYERENEDETMKSPDKGVNKFGQEKNFNTHNPSNKEDREEIDQKALDDPNRKSISSKPTSENVGAGQNKSEDVGCELDEKLFDKKGPTEQFDAYSYYQRAVEGLSEESRKIAEATKKLLHPQEAHPKEEASIPYADRPMEPETSYISTDEIPEYNFRSSVQPLSKLTSSNGVSPSALKEKSADPHLQPHSHSHTHSHSHSYTHGHTHQKALGKNHGLHHSGHSVTPQGFPNSGFSQANAKSQSFNHGGVHNSFANANSKSFGVNNGGFAQSGASAGSIIPSGGHINGFNSNGATTQSGAGAFNNGGFEQSAASAGSIIQKPTSGFGSNGAIAQSGAGAFNNKGFGPSGLSAGSIQPSGGQINGFNSNGATAQSGAGAFNNGGFEQSAVSAGSIIQKTSSGFGSNGVIAQSGAGAFNNKGFGLSGLSAGSIQPSGGQINGFNSNGVTAQSEAGAFNNGGFEQSAASAGSIIQKPTSGFGSNGAIAQSGAGAFNNKGFGPSGLSAGSIQPSGDQLHGFGSNGATAHSGAEAFNNGGFGQSAASAASAGSFIQNAPNSGYSSNGAIANSKADAHNRGFGSNTATSQSETFNSGWFGQPAETAGSFIQNGGQLPVPSTFSESAAQSFSNGGFGQSNAQAAAQAGLTGHNLRHSLGPGFHDTNAFNSANAPMIGEQPREKSFVMPHLEEIPVSELLSEMEYGMHRSSRAPQDFQDSLIGLDLASSIVDASLNKNSFSDNGLRVEGLKDKPKDAHGSMGFVTNILDSSLKAGKEITENNSNFERPSSTTINSESARQLTLQHLASITDLVGRGLRSKRQTADDDNASTNRLFQDVRNNIIAEKINNLKTHMETNEDIIIRNQNPDKVLPINVETEDNISDQHVNANKNGDYHKNVERAFSSQDDDIENSVASSKDQEKTDLKIDNPDILTHTPKTMPNKPWASNWDYENKKAIYDIPDLENQQVKNTSYNLETNKDNMSFEKDKLQSKDTNIAESMPLFHMHSLNTSSDLENPPVTENSNIEVIPRNEITLDLTTNKSNQNSMDSETELIDVLHKNDKDDIIIDVSQKEQTVFNMTKNYPFKDNDTILSKMQENNDTYTENEENLRFTEIKEKEPSFEIREEMLPSLFYANGTRKNISDLTSEEIQGLQFDLPNNPKEVNTATQQVDKNNTNDGETLLRAPLQRNQNINDHTKNTDINEFNSDDDQKGEGNILQSYPSHSISLDHPPNDYVRSIIFNMSGGPFNSIEAEMGSLTEEEKDAFFKQEVDLIAQVIEETFKNNKLKETNLNTNTTESVEHDTKEGTEKGSVVTSPNIFDVIGRQSNREEYSRQARSPNEHVFNDLLEKHKEKVKRIKNIAENDDDDLLLISFIGDSVIQDLENRRNKSGQLNQLNHNNQSNQTSDNTKTNQSSMLDQINLNNLTNKMDVLNQEIQTNVTYDANLLDEDSSKKNKREIRSSRTPLTQIMTDPMTKLDIEKTLQNLGSIARHTFENPRAPMYHVRNMLGNARNSVMSAVKVPPNNFLIPSKYEIARMSQAKESNGEQVGAVNQKMLLSRSGFGNTEAEDKLDESKSVFNGKSFGLENTVQKLGGMLKETVQSGRDTVAHVNDVAADAKKLLYTSKYVTPRLIIPHPKSTLTSRGSYNMPVSGNSVLGSYRSNSPANKKAVLITPRIFEVQKNIVGATQEHPENFVGMGHIFDAVGLSAPNQPEVELQKIEFEPITIKPFLMPNKLKPNSAMMKNNVEDKNKQNAILGAQKSNAALPNLFQNGELAATTENLKDFMQRMHDEMKEMVRSQYEERKRMRKERTKSKTKQHQKNKKDRKDLKKPIRQTEVPIENPNQLLSPNVVGNSNPYIVRNNYDKNAEMALSPELLDLFSKYSQNTFNLNNNMRAEEDHVQNTLGIPIYSRTQDTVVNQDFQQIKPVNSLRALSYANNYPYQQGQRLASTFKNPKEYDDAEEKEQVEFFLPDNLMKPFMGQPSDTLIHDYMREHGDEDVFEETSDGLNSQTVENADEKEKVAALLPPELMKPFMGQPSQTLLHDYMREYGDEVFEQTSSDNSKTIPNLSETIKPINSKNAFTTMKPLSPPNHISYVFPKPEDIQKSEVFPQASITPFSRVPSKLNPFSSSHFETAVLKPKKVEAAMPRKIVDENEEEKVAALLPPELTKPFMQQPSQTLLHNYMREYGDEDVFEQTSSDNSKTIPKLSKTINSVNSKNLLTTIKPLPPANHISSVFSKPEDIQKSESFPQASMTPFSREPATVYPFSSHLEKAVLKPEEVGAGIPSKIVNEDEEENVAALLPPELMKPFMGQPSQTLLHDYMREYGDEDVFEQKSSDNSKAIPKLLETVEPINSKNFVTTTKPLSPSNHISSVFPKPDDIQKSEIFPQASTPFSGEPSKVNPFSSSHLETLVLKPEKVGAAMPRKIVDEDVKEKVAALLPSGLMRPQTLLQDYMREYGDEEVFEKPNSDNSKTVSTLSEIIKPINLRSSFPTMKPPPPPNHISAVFRKPVDSINTVILPQSSITFSPEPPKLSPFSSYPKLAVSKLETDGAAMPRKIGEEDSPANSSEISKKTKELVELLSDPEIDESEGSQETHRKTSKFLDTHKGKEFHVITDLATNKTTNNRFSEKEEPQNANTLENVQENPYSLSFRKTPLSVGHVPDENDLGYVLGAINPMMFERHFNERLKINDTSSKDTHDKFLAHGLIESEYDDSKVVGAVKAKKDSLTENQLYNKHSPAEVDEKYENFFTTNKLKLPESSNQNEDDPNKIIFPERSVMDIIGLNKKFEAEKDILTENQLYNKHSPATVDENYENFVTTNTLKVTESSNQKEPNNQQDKYIVKAIEDVHKQNKQEDQDITNKDGPNKIISPERSSIYGIGSNKKAEAEKDILTENQLYNKNSPAIANEKYENVVKTNKLKLTDSSNQKEPNKQQDKDDVKAIEDVHKQNKQVELDNINEDAPNKIISLEKTSTYGIGLNKKFEAEKDFLRENQFLPVELDEKSENLVTTNNSQLVESTDPNKSSSQQDKDIVKAREDSHQRNNQEDKDNKTGDEPNKINLPEKTNTNIISSDKKLEAKKDYPTELNKKNLQVGNNNNYLPVKKDEKYENLVTSQVPKLTENRNQNEQMNKPDKYITEAKENIQRQNIEDEQDNKNEDDPNSINSQGRTSMKVIGPYKKPFMGYITKKKMNKFLNQYNNNLSEGDDDEQQGNEYTQNTNDDKENIEPMKYAVFSSMNDESDYGNGF